MSHHKIKLKHQNAKVAFFNYWTKGIENLFLPIAKFLDTQGIESILIHVGSWRDPTVPSEETIQGLLCRDIRFYGGSLQRAIEVESPQVVLMVNPLTADRILTRICRTKGIKSAYLMNGILPTGNDYQQAIHLTNRAFSWQKRIGKIPKYLQITAQYLKAMRAESYSELVKLSNYYHFFELIRSPGKAIRQPKPHKDVYTDRALVYGKAYRDLFTKVIGYPDDRVVVVGNPNLDQVIKFFKRPTAEAEAQTYIEELGVPQGIQAVAYMEDNFADESFGFWQLSTLIAELRAVAYAVKKAGLHLLIKLHPLTEAEPILRTFEHDSQVHVLKKADLSKLLLGSVATVGHISTTLMIPIIYNRPVLSPIWSPKVNTLEYYLKHGVAKPVSSKEELIKDLQNVVLGFNNATKRKQFLDNFVTYRDGQSQDRIHSEILQLLTPQ